ncbi:hypothetical protein [Bacillus mobilis]|nr:hypothetical protein [Bacillus mobilis]
MDAEESTSELKKKGALAPFFFEGYFCISGYHHITIKLRNSLLLETKK